MENDIIKTHQMKYGENSSGEVDRDIALEISTYAGSVVMNCVNLNLK